MHIVLIVCYINHWEHHVTLPFTPTNNNFWPVVLSASLQAFYTLYTAILVFLTQQLAMSSALIRRLKLTTIHDVSSAWAGLGSALSSVWKQTGIPASLWATAAVTTYLICISVLHITSSTLLHFQTFNSSLPTNVSTTLGWVDLTNFIFNPIPITASLPAISQFSGLISAGLSGNTVYDTLQTSSAVGHAMVNATTITSNCGLIPNVTYDGTTAMRNVIPSFLIIPTGTDQIHVIESSLMTTDRDPIQPSVTLMVSTLLDIEPSVRKEVAVPMIWVPESLSAFGFWNISTILTFSCSCKSIH
ncbi:hypothetical protein P692DRAFT_20830339 [Suillus brevipes Sb2]|nr:hypothetical protein P692DRAFT_20830339 [Suillus brevipes Sb2]